MPVKMGLNDCSLVRPIIRQFHAINALITIHHSFQLTNTIYICIQITHSVFNYFILRFISFATVSRFWCWLCVFVEYVLCVKFFLLLPSVVFHFVSVYRINRPIPAQRYWSLSLCSQPLFPYSSNILRSFIWLSLKCA